MARIHILNTDVDDYSMEEAISEILRFAKKHENAYVVTPNLDHLINIEHDKEFAKAYRNASLILADGISLIYLAKMYHTPLKEKVSGSELFPRICELAAREGHTLFILGAKPGVASLAGENLKRKYPSLKVVGTYSPTFQFDKDMQEIETIIRIVREVKPDIMAVSLGDMKAEKFVSRYRNALQVPVSLCIGAAVDFEAGTKKRAPRWISHAGLEWLYRCIQEPRRIGRRVIRDIWYLLPLLKRYSK